VKPHHDFTAERPVARHQGLGGRGDAQAFDPAQALARLAQRLALDLPEALGALGGDTLPEVKALEPRQGVMRELLSRGASPCSHGLVAGAEGTPQLLVSLDCAGALQLVDMAFGGEGKVPDPLPEKLPLSAQLVVARIEGQVAALVARIAGIASSEPQVPALAPLRRNTDIAAQRPFTADRPLWQISFDVCFGEAEAWTLRLTLAAEHAPLLCGADEDDAPSAARPVQSGGSGAAQQAFADIPLTLRATLVDMRVPLARIASLKPGDVLPISVARQVPLTAGDATIALGTLGETDDRVALQIIQAFPSQETPT
jgi:flagellar motor switch protein FliM